MQVKRKRDKAKDNQQNAQVPQKPNALPASPNAGKSNAHNQAIPKPAVENFRNVQQVNDRQTNAQQEKAKAADKAPKVSLQAPGVKVAQPMPKTNAPQPNPVNTAAAKEAIKNKTKIYINLLSAVSFITSLTVLSITNSSSASNVVSWSSLRDLVRNNPSSMVEHLMVNTGILICFNAFIIYAFQNGTRSSSAKSVKDDKSADILFTSNMLCFLGLTALSLYSYGESPISAQINMAAVAVDIGLYFYGQKQISDLNTKNKPENETGKH